MKLSEIRSYIGNILDYQPDITTYKQQLDAVINEQYFRLFFREAVHLRAEGGGHHRPKG